MLAHFILILYTLNLTWCLIIYDEVKVNRLSDLWSLQKSVCRWCAKNTDQVWRLDLRANYHNSYVKDLLMTHVTLLIQILFSTQIRCCCWEKQFWMILIHPYQLCLKKNKRSMVSIKVTKSAGKVQWLRRWKQLCSLYVSKKSRWVTDSLRLSPSTWNRMCNNISVIKLLY